MKNKSGCIEQLSFFAWLKRGGCCLLENIKNVAWPLSFLFFKNRLWSISSSINLPIFLLGGIIMVTTGCAGSGFNKMAIPGNPNTQDFAIDFDQDWDIFESGTYTFCSERIAPDRMWDHTYSIGGTRAGYRNFYILVLDFKFKDGREYHKEIDTKPIILDMLKKHTIKDLSKTRWGGFAEMIVRIKKDSLAIDYRLVEYRFVKRAERHIANDHLPSKKYYYPIYKTVLD